jgi:hypothetical protein
MAFGLGWVVQGRVNDCSATASLNALADENAPEPSDFPMVEGLLDGHSDDDALTMWVHNDQGRPQPLSVPLVDAAVVDRQFGMQFQSGIPRHVRQQLEEDGYRVESRRRYAPLWFDGGRPLVVPVEDTQIVPVNRVVY